jgi:hypothetical protein
MADHRSEIHGLPNKTRISVATKVPQPRFKFLFQILLENVYHPLLYFHLKFCSERIILRLRILFLVITATLLFSVRVFSSSGICGYSILLQPLWATALKCYMLNKLISFTSFYVIWFLSTSSDWSYSFQLSHWKHLLKRLFPPFVSSFD